MDSNRRHQLQENALAKWFTTQYEEWIAPNSGLLSTLVLVVLIVLCVVLGFFRFTEWSKSTAWKKYYVAFSAENPHEELQKLAESSSEPVRSRARLTLAQIMLGEGCNAAFADKTKAETQLENAVEQFDRLRKDAPSDTLRQQAAFGHAQALEALAALRTGSDLADAEKEYRDIAKQWPDSYYGKRADKQVLMIAQADTKMFLEKSIAKAAEQPKPEDFKVEIDTKDPFLGGPQGFDAQKALGEGEKKDGEPKTDQPGTATSEPKTETKVESKPEPKTEVKEPAKEEPKPETKAETAAEPKTEAKEGSKDEKK